MKENDYLNQIAINIYDMQQLNINYKYMYDKEKRQELFKLARKISRYNKIDINETKKPINGKELIPNFLESLEIFNSEVIYDYFKNHTKKIKFERNNTEDEEDASLGYKIQKNSPTKFYIYLPKKRLTLTNQVGFAHEMGHIPEIDKPRKSYMEYFETIPIFFEYISSINCFKENPKDIFSCTRMNMELDEASNLLKLYKRCELKNNTQSLYFQQDFIDSYKYLESFDFALQLVDIFEKDKEIVSKEIEKVISGKSLIDVYKELEIDTDNCKRLLYEYKRMTGDEF